MSESTNADPALPLDLERLIFEFAAEQYPLSIPRLLRVCQRVYAWLKPSLYRVLNLDHSPLVQAIQHGFDSDSNELSVRSSRTKESLLSRIFKWYTPPAAEIVEGSRAAFLKANVRHILYTTPDGYFDANREWQTITQLLRLNPSFFELTIKKYSSTVLASSNKQQLPKEMRPTRLTVQFNRDYYATVHLTERLFSSVTHLTLLNTAIFDRFPESWADWALGLPRLPALTHLCVTNNIAKAIILHVFPACPRLQAFVAFWWTEPIPLWERERAQKPRELAKKMARRASATAKRNSAGMIMFQKTVRTTPDMRVVLTAAPDFFDAWERGVRSGNVMWTHVEHFIARKRRGEIEANEYILEEDAWV
ncbi:hypothetical protein B0H19DRAFT_1262683 [Mycena capillaripes]|nr:hypothetical protein B0H19DRAFT_1262683 [Mycena capillaripes]